jgi:hypothetical protein
MQKNRTKRRKKKAVISAENDDFFVEMGSQSVFSYKNGKKMGGGECFSPILNG